MLFIMTFILSPWLLEEKWMVWCNIPGIRWLWRKVSTFKSMIQDLSWKRQGFCIQGDGRDLSNGGILGKFLHRVSGFNMDQFGNPMLLWVERRQLRGLAPGRSYYQALDGSPGAGLEPAGDAMAPERRCQLWRTPLPIHSSSRYLQTVK